MGVNIYGLVEPLTNELRYVGQTVKSPCKRRRIHLALTRAGRRSPVNNWIRKLLNKDLIPQIFVIERVDDPDWQEAERFWIAYFRGLGARLTNIAPGGEGGGARPQHYEKLRVLFKGRIFSESHKQKIREGLARSKMERSEAAKRVWADPAHKQKMQGHFEKLSQIQKARWAKYRAEKELRG